jgi:uncharacterized protein
MSQPPAPGQGSPGLTPVTAEERIPVLDVLRGFALLGIILMNMPGFIVPWGAWAREPRMFPGFADKAAEFFLTTVFAGKANSIFSFLFGLGLTLQLERAEARGTGIASLYLRRLLVLLLIGAAHGILIWNGDVLHIYAVLGLLLLALRRAPDKWIFGIIGVCIIAPLVRSGYALYTQEVPVRPLPEWVAISHRHMRIFQEGTYAEQVAARIETYVFTYGVLLRRVAGSMWVYVSFTVTMLLGFLAGRKRLFADVAATAPKIRKVMWWCLGLGLTASISLAVLGALWKPTPRPTVQGFFMGMLFNVHRPLLCVAYIAAITLLFQRDRFKRALLWLSPAGRMPLTNYLLQSVIATTIFNSYGLALFGKVGPLLGLLLSVAIFVVQVFYSRWWFARFQFGPLEWLWRAVTYGKLPAMRVQRKAATITTASAESAA